MALEEALVQLGTWPDGKPLVFVCEDMHDCSLDLLYLTMYYRMGAFYQQRQIMSAPAEREEFRVRDPARLFFHSVKDDFGVSIKALRL